MKHRIGRILIPTMVLMLLFGTLALWHYTRTAEATPVGDIRERLGNFTGPASGTEQDDNVKASLDLIHDIVGAPLLAKGTGSIFYVDSGASGGETGLNWTDAVLTLNEGVDLCTEDRGDYILLAPGHTEVLAAADAVDIDLAGVSVKGIGSGEQRPVFDVTADGEIRIDDADFRIENCVFKAHTDSVVHCFDITDNAHGFVIKDCDFIVDTEGTDEFDDAIDIVAGADYGVIKNCNFHMGGADAVSAITFDSSDFLTIEDCFITGDYSTACIVGETAASLGVLIKDNALYNGDTGTFGLNEQPCIELYATDNGMIINNFCACNVAIPELAIVAADMLCFGNTYNETEGVYGAREIGLVPGRTYAAKCTTSTAFAEDLFVVAGGPIMITSFVGQVTTAINGDAGDLHVWCDATVTTNDILFSTAVANEGDAIGTIYCFDLDDGQAVLDPQENGGSSTYGNWFCPIGTIEQSNTDVDCTGVIDWYMTFIPLVDGVTVTPQ